MTNLLLCAKILTTLDTSRFALLHPFPNLAVSSQLRLHPFCHFRLSFLQHGHFGLPRLQAQGPVRFELLQLRHPFPRILMLILTKTKLKKKQIYWPSFNKYDFLRFHIETTYEKFNINFSRKKIIKMQKKISRISRKILLFIPLFVEISEVIFEW